MSKIKVGDCAPFYQTYIDKVKPNPEEMLGSQKAIIEEYLIKNQERLNYSYDVGKWSIKEVMLHICDTESVFAYRLLTISRGDQTPLPGMDQDVFMAGCDLSNFKLEKLIHHFKCTREYTISLVDTMTEEQLDRVGVASGQKVSCGSIVYMIAGHTQHHINILLERYS